MAKRPHELKTWPVFFEQIDNGTKTFELRRNDRGFETGDTLILNEWDERTEMYTGRQCKRQVVGITNLQSIPGLAVDGDYVLLSLGGDPDFEVKGDAESGYDPTAVEIAPDVEFKITGQNVVRHVEDQDSEPKDDGVPTGVFQAKWPLPESTPSSPRCLCGAQIMLRTCLSGYVYECEVSCGIRGGGGTLEQAGDALRESLSSGMPVIMKTHESGEQSTVYRGTPIREEPEGEAVGGTAFQVERKPGPCPFCGPKEDEMQHPAAQFKDHEWRVVCVNGCRGPWRDNRSEAVRAWDGLRGSVVDLDKAEDKLEWMRTCLEWLRDEVVSNKRHVSHFMVHKVANVALGDFIIAALNSVGSYDLYEKLRALDAEAESNAS